MALKQRKLLELPTFLHAISIECIMAGYWWCAWWEFESSCHNLKCLAMKGLRNKSVCINKRAHLTATAIALKGRRKVWKSGGTRSNVAGIICPHLNKVNSLIDLPKYGGGAIVPLPLSPYSGISDHVPKECVEQKKSPVMILTLCTLGKGGLQPGTTVYWAKPSHYFTLLAAFWRLWQELNFAPPLFHFNAVRSHTGSFTCFSA